MCRLIGDHDGLLSCPVSTGASDGWSSGAASPLQSWPHCQRLWPEAGHNAQYGLRCSNLCWWGLAYFAGEKCDVHA